MQNNIPILPGGGIDTVRLNLMTIANSLGQDPEVISDIMHAELRDPDSLLSKTLAKQLEVRRAKTVPKQQSVVISRKIADTDASVFRVLFSEYDITFKPFDSSGADLLTTCLYLYKRLLMTMLGPKRGGYIDVNGDISDYAFSRISEVHCCINTKKTSGLLYASAANVRLRSAVHGATKSGNEHLLESLSRVGLDGGVTYCKDGLDCCSVESDCLIYDVFRNREGLPSMIELMANHGCTMGVAIIPWDPSVYTNDEGELTFLKGRFKKSKGTITFYFQNDTLSQFTLTEADYFRYVESNVYDHPSGTYLLEYIGKRGNMMAIKVIKPAMSAPASAVSHNVWLSIPNDDVVFTSYELRHNRCSPTRYDSYVRKEFVVPKSLYFKVRHYAMSLDPQIFKKEAIMAYADVASSRCVVSGLAVTAPYSIGENVMKHLVRSVFCTTFIERFETIQTEKYMLADLRHKHKLNDAGLFKLCFVALRTTFFDKPLEWLSDLIVGSIKRFLMSYIEPKFQHDYDIKEPYVSFNDWVYSNCYSDKNYTFEFPTLDVSKKVDAAIINVLHKSPKSVLSALATIPEPYRTLLSIKIKNGGIEAMCDTSLYGDTYKLDCDRGWEETDVTEALNDVSLVICRDDTVDRVKKSVTAAVWGFRKYWKNHGDVIRNVMLQCKRRSVLILDPDMSGDDSSNLVDSLVGSGFTVYTCLQSEMYPKRGDSENVKDILFKLYPYVDFSNVDHDMEVYYTDDVVNLDPKVKVPEVYDPVSVLQEAYDEAVPDVSLQTYVYDQSSLHYDDQFFQFCAPALALTLSSLKPIRKEKLVVPRLRTGMPHKRQQTLKNSLQAAVKRNFEPASVSTAVPYDVVFKEAWERTAELFFIPDWREKLAEYQRDPVYATEKEFNEWASRSAVATTNALRNTDANPFSWAISKFAFMVKSDPKPQMSRSVLTQTAPPATILAHSKQVNAMFSPQFTKMRERIMALLSPNVLMMMKKNTMELEEFFRAYDRPGENSNYVEIDGSMYDKSQRLTTHKMEWEVYRLLGLNVDDLERWARGHLVTHNVSYSGMAFSTFLQRKSGDATTALGNTLINLLTTAYCYRGLSRDNIKCAAFLGDDSLIITRRAIDTSGDEVVARVANIPTKIDQRPVGYFCSAYVVKSGTQTYLMSDPVKRTEKLGKWHCYKPELVDEQYIAFNEIMRNYDNKDACDALAPCVMNRVEHKFNVRPMIYALSTLARDRSRFEELFDTRIVKMVHY